MKKVCVIQSNYIPWKGYFDIIAASDEFIIYDNVQFTKNDWRNRNKIKTPNGVEWISVPVGQNTNKKIREVQLPNSLWQKKHWKTLEGNYKRANYFDDIASWLAPLYINNTYLTLSELNYTLIRKICEYLEIETKISFSWDYKLIEGKTDRLIDLILQSGATEYISGPTAKSYLNENDFNDVGVKLTWFNYDNYPEYPQLWDGFFHNVSILDLLFNCGKNSTNYMKYRVEK
jgi:hypothetical protein